MQELNTEQSNKFVDEDYVDMADLLVELIDFTIGLTFGIEICATSEQLSPLKKNFSEVIKKWHQAYPLEMTTFMAALVPISSLTKRNEEMLSKQLERLERLYALLLIRHQNHLPLEIQTFVSLIKTYGPILKDKRMDFSKKPEK